MKKLFFIQYVAVAVLLTSCNLDLDPQDKLADTNYFNNRTELEALAVSTCKCTARKVKEYFRKNTQKGYENLIFLSGDGLFFQQLC